MQIWKQWWRWSRWSGVRSWSFLFRGSALIASLVYLLASMSLFHVAAMWHMLEIDMHSEHMVSAEWTAISWVSSHVWPCHDLVEPWESGPSCFDHCLGVYAQTRWNCVMLRSSWSWDDEGSCGYTTLTPFVLSVDIWRAGGRWPDVLWARTLGDMSLVMIWLPGWRVGDFISGKQISLLI